MRGGKDDCPEDLAGDRSPGDAAYLGAVVRLALSEDVGPGDVTSLTTVPPGRAARARIAARREGVLSGLAAAREVARAVDPEVRFTANHRDGARLAPGEIVAVLEGEARGLLSMERTLLNFLQRLSGVATLTARFVAAVEGTGVAVADTRKTTPGLRFLEKQAVLHGGGVNHRLGLYDAFMVKDNHIAAAGGITAAVERVRASQFAGLPLTVEAADLGQAEEAARLGVDQILLDNMDPGTIRSAVAVVRRIEAESGTGPIRIEVSGGVDLETVRSKAVPGVDWISVGALTHSAPALDLAMDLELA